MSMTAIVTDSTSDLPEEIRSRYGILVVPLSVSFQDKIYVDDRKSIDLEDFYQMMARSETMPKASQPTPGDFFDLYSALLDEGKTVLSIHISRKLSGTLNSAELAARQLEGGRVHIVDSEMVHMPCGFLAMKAAALARQGLAPGQIMEALPLFKKKIHSFFIPRSLDNLIKGGRISKIKGLFANLLEVKPILTLKDGEVSLWKNARKWETAKKDLFDSMESRLEKKGRLIVSIGDVASDKEAGGIEKTIRQRFQPAELFRVKIGIVVGSHLGIGGIGVTFFEEDEA